MQRRHLRTLLPGMLALTLGGCLSAPAPDRLVSAAEYQTAWNDPAGYWAPTAVELTRAKAALRKAIGDHVLPPEMEIPFPRYALIFCGVMDGRERLIEIIGWRNWPKGHPPPGLGTFVLDGSPSMFFRVYYLVSKDTIAGQRPSVAERFQGAK